MKYSNSASQFLFSDGDESGEIEWEDRLEHKAVEEGVGYASISIMDIIKAPLKCCGFKDAVFFKSLATTLRNSEGMAGIGDERRVKGEGEPEGRGEEGKLM